jgi:hypothetical protein
LFSLFVLLAVPTILTDIKTAVTALTQIPFNVRPNHIKGADCAREPAAPAGRTTASGSLPPPRKDAALRSSAAITTTLQAVDALHTRFDNAVCVE